MSSSVCFDLQYSLEDQRFYALPTQISSNFKGQPEPINVEKQLKTLPKPLQAAAVQAVAHFNEYLKIWKVEYNQKKEITFQFELPPSAFNSKITIFQKLSNLVQNEYNTVSKLQEQQIEQIFQTGTFEIPSKRFPIPYIWQLSSWVMKGRVNIIKSYYQDLGLAYSGIYSIADRYYHENDHLNGFRFTIRSGLYNLGIKPIVYLGIIIGMKEMDEYTDIHRISCAEEFLRQIQLRKKTELDQSVYQYLKFDDNKESYKKASQLYNKLIEYASKFEDDLSGIRMYMTNLYDLLEEKEQNTRLVIEKEEQEEYRDNLKEELNQSAYYAKKYNISVNSSIDLESQIQKQIYLSQIQHWKSGPFDGKVINQICNLVECQRVYQYYRNLMSREIEKSVEIFRKQLIKSSPVKTQCYRYLNEQINEFKKSIKPSLKKEMSDNILKELKQMEIIDVKVYENFRETKKQMQLNIQQKIKSKKYTTIQASNQIVCMRQCFPPYNVILENGYYRLERIKYYHINSNYHGWRIVLMFLTWYTWTMNVMFFLFANAISGPLGIRALLSMNKFHPDVEINSKTGKISPNYYEVTPVYLKLKKVYDGMMKSRRYFEESPDTGFFGKNYSRLWNLVEVYIFRMIFAGILFTLILIPSFIICNVVISILLAITAWAWQPFAILIIFLFKTLIYDFDLKGSRASLWRQRKGIPLIMNTYHILVNGILQILLSLIYILLIAPLFALIVAIYSTSRRFLRSCFDSFMIRIIKILGRVPATESNLAWKISGPGLSRKYFYGITNQQVILMVCAELEKMILSIYKKKLNQQIQEPSKQTQQLLSDFVKVFHANINFSDQGANLLENQLSKQISQRIEMFPTLQVQVRFTEEELLFLLKQVKQFVKAQIKLKDLSNHIWDHYSIKKGDYNALTEKLLTITLGAGALVPFEDVEMRFSLKAEDNFEFMQKVERALEGQIQLEKSHRHSIKQTEAQEKQIKKEFIPFKNVIAVIFQSQSLQQNWTSYESRDLRFIQNLSAIS